MESTRILHARPLDSAHCRQHSWNSSALAYDDRKKPQFWLSRKTKSEDFLRTMGQLTCPGHRKKGRNIENPNLAFNLLFNPQLWL